MHHNPVIDCLMNRKSVRKYKEATPDTEIIETVVRAGQQAPFASQLSSVVYQTGKKFAFGAPLWFLICVDAHKLEQFMQLRGWEIVTNDLTLLLFGMQDASYMAQNMVIAAESLGMGSCFLGEGSINAKRITHLAKRLRLPNRVLPMVELVMGYPDEAFPTRPRFPMEFTLFRDRYPELKDEEVRRAMKAMDDGYIDQGYYRKQKAKIPLENGRQDPFTYEDYGWTEHIARKWGQWTESPNDLIAALEARGFSLSKKES